MMIPVLQNNLPAWAVMWIMAFSIYAFCKILSWWQVKSTLLSPNKYKSLIYLFLWPGMDASSFIFKPTNHLQPALKDWMSASIKLIIGILLFFGAAWTFPVNHPMIKGWIGMIGLVMLLHFGIFHLLALTWQKLGMNAECLFYKPILSTSVGDFWGGRWNKAFRDLTHKFIYNPLRPRIGVAGSIFVGFLISGLVHELVISVPAKGGYGLPTMYFLIQAVGIYVERSKIGKTLKLQQGIRGWLFTLLIIAGPVYWLFHPLFVKNVIIPFMQVMVIR